MARRGLCITNSGIVTYSSRLKEFAIDSKNIRVGSQVHKGYDLEQFSDSFSRHTPISPNLSATALQTTETESFTHVSLPLQNILEKLSATRKPPASKDCSAVADKMPKNTHVDEYLLEERAAIMEYDGGLTREEAELAVWENLFNNIC